MPASDPPASASIPASTRGYGWWPWLLLLALPWAIYARCLPFDVLHIDDDILYASPLLHGGGWAGFGAVWREPYFGDYAPVSLATQWLDLALGVGPGAWQVARAQHILWLGLGALAVFAAMRRIGGRDHAGIAWAVAVLYVVHPVCADATLWLAERKSLVAFALSWWCLERHLAWRQGGGWRPAIAMWVLAIAALLAKPHAVALPVMLAAWEVACGPDAPGWPPHAGRWWRWAAPVLPLAGVVAVYVALELHGRGDLGPQLLGGNRPAALWCDGWILGQYLIDVVAPHGLTLYYSVIDDPTRIVALGASWAGVAAAVGGTIAVAARRRLVACGWLLAGAAMLPALNVVAQPVPMTDYYLQWGLPGILLALVVAVADAGTRLRVTPRLGLAACAVIAVALAGASAARVGDYRSREELFARAYALQPDCATDASGYVDGLIAAHGPFHRDSGAIALKAMNQPRGHMLDMFFAPTAIEAGVEQWRREVDAGRPGRPGTRAWADRVLAGVPQEYDLYIWAEILAGIGGPAECAELEQVVARGLGPGFRTSAAEIARRCGDGAVLPDAIPPLITLTAYPDDDPLWVWNLHEKVVDAALVLMQTRVHRALDSHDQATIQAAYADAFGLAGLCLNIMPAHPPARRFTAGLYGLLGHPEAAARVAAGAPRPAP